MKKKFSLFLLTITALLLLSASGASAQTRQRVRFARGAAEATLSGTVRGYAYRDYVVTARAGQTISVEIDGRTINPVFTIFKPGGENLEGAMQRGDFTGELPDSGDYVIRVGMMRAHARRKNSAASYTLRVSVQ